ncbi:MAG: hypothetical protein FRX49_10259 [Trebouxia sp. A1-2]|nr:MAG: hypothetical protein FRX49_10259 [Trebouxia sp. A1-2]
MASATLEYNGSQVTNSLNSQRAKFEQFAGTEAAIKAINELLDTEAEAKAYGAALTAVQNSYVPGARTTNFKKDLDQHAARLLPSLRQQPEMKQYYQDVSERLQIEDEAAQQQDGDDDEIQMGGSNTGAAPNATCPLSGKPVSGVVSPSKIAYQFCRNKYCAFYDNRLLAEPLALLHKAVFLAAATSHFVTMATLKKANKVIRLQKKAQRLGTQGQTQADADVVDVE